MEPLVIFIIGDNRSGSTLLDYLLSNHPRMISVGEMHHLHGYFYKIGIGKRTDWRCSCGEFVENCKFWQPILNEVSFNSSFETWLGNQEPKWSFINHAVHKLYLKKLINNDKVYEKGKRVAENRWKLYHSIMQKTGKSIIIDSSKFALEGLFLYNFRKGDIYFLFLERNIWEIAYSKLRRNQSLHKGVESKEVGSIYKEIIGSYRMLWRNRLLVDEIQKKSKEILVKKINYLDLTKNPEETISEICSFLKIEKFAPPKITKINHRDIHVLGGSPSRYEKTAIQPDVRWKNYYKKNPIALYFSKILQKV